LGTGTKREFEPERGKALQTAGGEPAKDAAEAGALPADRRRAHRYTLELGLEFKARSRNRGLWIGHGEIRNISHEGLLFTTNSSLPFASSIELSIHWPVMVEDCRLDLQVTGTVLGTFPRGTVVLIGKARFRRKFL
jgi:hypothetical protein